MVRHASYIEVAVAERSAPIPKAPFLAARLKLDLAAATTEVERRQAKAEYQRELASGFPVGERVSFRVVRRLKGAGPDRFQLDTAGAYRPSPGQEVTFRKGMRRIHMRSTLGAPVPIAHQSTEHTPDARPLGADCSGGPGIITAALGQRYLVFRDVAGRLLGPTIPARRGGPPRFSGYVYEPVVGPKDLWVQAVDRAVANAGRRRR